MKIQGNTYLCEWCNEKFEQVIGRCSGNGRKGVGVDQCICPKCNRYVSQKTEMERKTKLDRGERI